MCLLTEVSGGSTHIDSLISYFAAMIFSVCKFSFMTLAKAWTIFLLRACEEDYGVVK